MEQSKKGEVVWIKVSNEELTKTAPMDYSWRLLVGEGWHKPVPLSSIIESRMPTEREIQLEVLTQGSEDMVGMKKGIEWLKNKLTSKP